MDHKPILKEGLFGWMWKCSCGYNKDAFPPHTSKAGALKAWEKHAKKTKRKVWSSNPALIDPNAPSQRRNDR